MCKLLLVLCLLLVSTSTLAAQSATPAAPSPTPPAWRERVVETMPLLGHRNWILIVDSAYPLQSVPGIETTETDAGYFEVVRHVLGIIDRSVHVRPVILMDAELPFVSEQDAPGVSAFRAETNDLFRGYPVESLPHDRLIANVEEAGKHFNVLVLKTNLTIPYTSVFIRLDCKYWGANAENRLRAKMAAAGTSAAPNEGKQPGR
jgi:hypothetical protein